MYKNPENVVDTAEYVVYDTGVVADTVSATTITTSGECVMDIKAFQERMAELEEMKRREQTKINEATKEKRAIEQLIAQLKEEFLESMMSQLSRKK